MSKIEFKEFVKKNTSLINYVEKGETTWQKLYELYDLYGENSNVWDKYLNASNVTNNSSNFKDLVNMIKGVDLNTVQNCLESVDKAIDAFKGIIPASATKEVSNINNYEPRPTYKYFED
ncbi:MAG: hypothetical protein IKN63_03580 [Bacilli bacterium]|nr:hypothetical protein [Bacilli bacterium]